MASALNLAMLQPYPFTPISPMFSNGSNSSPMEGMDPSVSFLPVQQPALKRQKRENDEYETAYGAPAAQPEPLYGYMNSLLRPDAVKTSTLKDSLHSASLITPRSYYETSLGDMMMLSRVMQTTEPLGLPTESYVDSIYGQEFESYMNV